MRVRNTYACHRYTEAAAASQKYVCSEEKNAKKSVSRAICSRQKGRRLCDTNRLLELAYTMRYNISARSHMNMGEFFCVSSSTDMMKLIRLDILYRFIILDV